MCMLPRPEQNISRKFDCRDTFWPQTYKYDGEPGYVEKTLQLVDEEK